MGSPHCDTYHHTFRKTLLTKDIFFQVKSAFTRAYNKEQHKTPYVLKGAPAKSRGKSSGLDYEGGEEQEDEEEEESIEKSAMLVKDKKSAGGRGKGDKKEQESKGKGRGRGKGKGAKS